MPLTKPFSIKESFRIGVSVLALVLLDLVLEKNVSLTTRLFCVALAMAALLTWISFGVVKRLKEAQDDLSLQWQEQATLMSAIWDGILAVDRVGAPLFFNSRFALLYGAEGLKNKPTLWKMFASPELLGAFKQALELGQTQVVKTQPFLGAPSNQSYFSISISPLKKPDGGTYGAVGIFHDISELKKAEQMQIDFVANVSHELRTPLTSIKGYTDTLLLDSNEGRPLDPKFLDIIYRNTQRLLSLINDLLDLSAIEASKKIETLRVETEEVTKKILNQIAGSLEQKKQKVFESYDCSTVVADPRRLEQVIVNLLDNASKYTPVGGNISVRWSRSDNGEVLLSVIDTGQGIGPEHLDRLFERFYRVDKGRTRDTGGTGLGLAIVKHIVNLHGGKVWAESTLGKGSVFYCSFPEMQLS